MAELTPDFAGRRSRAGTIAGTRRVQLVLLLSCAGLLTAARIARAVILTPSSTIGPAMAALPRVAGAAGDTALNRINQALERADERARKAAADCRAQGDALAQWARTVTVTMRGPHLLSLLVADSWFCGGAYPDHDQFPLVYSLDSGAPLNWSRLLPASALGKTTTDTAGDGTMIGTVSSPALRDLYLRRPGADSECNEALADLTLTFTLWPSAVLPGLTIQPFGLPHAVARCAETWTIPIGELRALRAHAELLQALEEAHLRKLYDLQR